MSGSLQNTVQIFVSIDNINMTALHLFNDSIVNQQGGFSQEENFKIIEVFFSFFLTPFSSKILFWFQPVLSERITSELCYQSSLLPPPSPSLHCKDTLRRG